MEIRDGKVQVKIKNNKKENKEIIELRINDGNWHHILITYTKKKKSLSITVDGTTEKTLKVQKSRVNRELYIGSLPDNITDRKKFVRLTKC